MSKTTFGSYAYASIRRLQDAYYIGMEDDRRAAAVALERDICQQIDAFLSDGDEGEDGQ